MSITSINAEVFYKEVAKAKSIWTIRNKGGIPTPTNADGEHAIPFWSTRERANNFLAKVEAYKGFTLLEVPWDLFVKSWAPGLEKDNLLVGVNWVDSNTSGFDMTPNELITIIEEHMGVAI